MISKRKPYKTYPKEFKLEAIRLMEESDRPASEIAMQLGIRRNQLYKWKEQMAKKGDVPSYCFKTFFHCQPCSSTGSKNLC